MLEIKNLHVQVEGKEILKGVTFTIEKGKVYALMGPNGSGKSTLSKVIMGHPHYEVTAGEILLDGKDVLSMSPDERSRAGLFMSFQQPVEIPGVTMSSFLRMAVQAHQEEKLNLVEFHKQVKEKMAELGIDSAFLRRYLNEGFSGGEKKRAEILQMALLKPSFAILDETDSGLDVDSLRVVSEGINKLRGSDIGILLITHYTRILNHIEPDVVHVLRDGKIVKSGGKELAHDIEEHGYDHILNN
ncbi:Fe-S cluster assembly ATPase SufC [Candidatus Woesearchaeota archaeon]|nr:MAG: Fe-S cluster assembly ATPase SufC [Candidatus Woesearchaeota archaeon]